MARRSFAPVLGEDDDHYRRRLGIFRRWTLPTPAALTAVLNHVVGTIGGVADPLVVDDTDSPADRGHLVVRVVPVALPPGESMDAAGRRGVASEDGLYGDADDLAIDPVLLLEHDAADVDYGPVTSGDPHLMQPPLARMLDRLRALAGAAGRLRVVAAWTPDAADARAAGRAVVLRHSTIAVSELAALAHRAGFLLVRTLPDATGVYASCAPGTPVVLGLAGAAAGDAPEEVRALGRRLALRKVYLSEKMVAQILEHLPRGRLGAAIAEKELPVEDEAVPQVVAEEDIADLSVREKAPPPTRYGPDGLEKPLRDVVETPGSRALRKSLIARDGQEPPDGYHAHHIVPEKDYSPGLDWLRNRLAEAGCGIDEAGNGVFLAGSRYTANPELTRLHLSYIHAGRSKEYAYTLTFRLGRLRGGALLREVEAIGEEMRGGEFKIMEIPYGWKGKWEPGMAVPADREAAPEWIEE
ncbi:AHH domain-containing protein [Streptomyces sp. NPDC048290]|uniref:AHH domain-containing protein n=1 Tax=Streptomyces sp. NPDC048290 TaxID=3155811 RepID=UPI00343CBDEF